jgi:hypothetical protein
MGRRCIELDGADQCEARRFDREAIALRHPTLLPDGGLTPDEVGRDARGAKASKVREPRALLLTGRNSISRHVIS